MRASPKAANVGVAHGDWGEDVAVEFLRRDGYEIIDRKVRPVPDDERLEIDIIAFDWKNDAMVFVEVKQHAARSPYQKRLRSITRRKCRNLRRACNAWRRINRWRGGCRFDVIEVYGTPGRRPEIDHIAHVPLFARPERFVRWSEA